MKFRIIDKRGVMNPQIYSAKTAELAMQSCVDDMVEQADGMVSPATVRARLGIATDPSEVRKLAASFSENLLAFIGPERLADVVRLNKERQIDHQGVCCSHDHCDANMVMAAAWEECFPDVQLLPIASQDDEHLRIWREAWDIAMKAEFKPEACNPKGTA